MSIPHQSKDHKSPDKIDRFLNHFREELDLIDTSESTLHKKILLSCLLDTIAHARFPNKSNKNKYLKFLIEFCDWKDAERVSALQLMLTLKRKKLVKGRLYKHISSHVEGWTNGNIIRSGSDPTFIELEPLAVAGDRKFLKEARYCELYYRYRNYLVHSFREPKSGIEMSADGNSPYYHSEIQLNDKDDPRGFKWRLVFPVEFFNNICRAGLVNLNKYLRENSLDPYQLYSFEDEWGHRKAAPIPNVS